MIFLKTKNTVWPLATTKNCVARNINTRLMTYMFKKSKHVIVSKSVLTLTA